MPLSALSRRRFLGCAGAAVAAPAILASAPATDIQVVEIKPSYEDFRYRTPIKFGGNVVDRVTLLNVQCTVRGRNGKTVQGFGSMPMGNVWSFPSKKLTYDQTLQAMRNLADRITKLTSAERLWGHPIDINVALEPQYAAAAAELSKGMAEPIPLLCTLVTASPFDAAIHDAYGKLHGRNCFQTLGKEFLHHDLSHYIGPEFRGETLDRYVSATAKPQLPLYHLVGAVDPIEPGDITQRINDGLPETLPDWIRYNGITHLKIKLNGDNRDWDFERVVRVHTTASKMERERGSQYVYSLDFNEKCPNLEYLMAFLESLQSRAPQAFKRVQYIEQPTARNLEANPQNVKAAAKLVPVVIDESLTSKETFMRALELGYSGAALKACKGQSQSLLMAAVAQKRKVFLCVQDLTCPGASLVHSVTLAAHIPGVKGIEANARQYVPVANQGWEKRLPGIFAVKDGMVRTQGIDIPGLGAVPA